jgi:hypothetical protein
MGAVTFDKPTWHAGNYTLRAHLNGRMVRCIATRQVLVDCLGADLPADGDMVRAAQAARATLEYAFRNRLLASDVDRPREAPVVLTHDTFFHWANCFGPDPPGR